MAVRVLGRAVKILVTLAWMLLLWLLDRTGLRWLWWRLTGGGEPYEVLRNEVLVRQAFEAMGPTFIKLGQMIASSPGMFPRRYSVEFKRCLDHVPEFDVALLRWIVARELDRPLDELFEELEDEPLGSASIAQVHGARLPDGRHVVVKVQRPGIQRVVDADLWWMRLGARLLEWIFRGARLMNLSGIIDDFDRTIHEELDFCREASNQDEFNRIMSRHRIRDVKAPHPEWGMVTERVLVMERFFGLKADDVEALEAADMDSEEFLRKGLRAWLMTVMLHGYFHGDAHAGNLMLLPEEQAVGFLDFGIIGRFTDQQRHQVMRYVLAFGAKDYEALADILIEIGAVKDDIDKEGLVRDLERVYAPLLNKAMGEIHYEDILPEATRVGYRYGVTLPREFLLILKQLVFFDRYAKLAAPQLNVFSDFYLVDFLFEPEAMQAGLDFNQLMPLLQKIQALHRRRSAGEEDGDSEAEAS